MRNVDDRAPDFALYNQYGHVIILSRYLDHYDNIVVYFFPQASAPGCTREAIGFNELIPEFTARKVAILGITGNTEAELKVFADANKLQFNILADPYKQICDEWGTNKGGNVARTTFVLNPKGRITHVFQRIDVFKHPQEVLSLFPVGGGESLAEVTAAPAAPAASAAPPVQAPAAPVVQAAPAAAAPVVQAAPVAAAPVVQAAAPVAAAPAATPAAPAPAAASHLPGDLVIANARVAMQLLLAHANGGGAVPPDLASLAGQVMQAALRAVHG